MKKHAGTNKDTYVRINPVGGTMKKSVYPSSCKQMYFSGLKPAPANSTAEMGAIFGESVSHCSSLNDRLKRELQQHPRERRASKIIREEGELEQVYTVRTTLIVIDSSIDALGFLKRQPEGLKEQNWSSLPLPLALCNDILMIRQKKK